MCLHADIVLMPGCTLPLLVSNSRAHWVVEQALAAPAPYACLIAVVSSLHCSFQTIPQPCGQLVIVIYGTYCQ